MLDEKGNPLSESHRDTKHGLVREMEVDVVFSYKDAVAFYTALGDNLKSIEENLKLPQEEKMKAFKERHA